MDHDEDLGEAVLRRQLFWDMYAHHQAKDPEVQKKIGIGPASPEVMDMEHTASHDRLDGLCCLPLHIRYLSGIAASLTVGGILDVPDEESRQEIVDQYGSLFSVATTAIVADLVSRGLLVPAFLEDENSHV